jgi:uncharacterized membrane protein YhhN
MKQNLLWLALIFAAGNWLAVAKYWKRMEYLTKPAVLILLIAWAGSVSALGGHHIWFLAGLVFSLTGDILMLLPKERFLTAWLAFMLAHVSYIVGFNPSFPPLSMASLLLAGLVSPLAFRLTCIILTGLKSSGEPRLSVPVALYSLVISAMLLSAILTLVRSEWPAGAALMVSAGAVLFFVSDLILALNRFVAPVRNSPVIIMITYHLGQGLIIGGASLHFSFPA